MPFVPFDKFERPAKGSKTLQQTMQENCNDRLPSLDPDCGRTTCVPYWHASGQQRCRPEQGVVEIEEVDGCGNARWSRVAELITWTDSGETRCDESLNRIQKEQKNQCGGSRWVTTNEKCCESDWKPVGEQTSCGGTRVKQLEEDGCGNERWANTSEFVEWVPSGEVRCIGDTYQIEVRNQCGDTQWETVPGGCPCIPDWQPSGTQRCTSEFIENYETDGCGNARWNPSTDLVIWSETGETRCNGSYVQREEISQCGTTRWRTTEDQCSNSPTPNELGTIWSGMRHTGGEYTEARIWLDAVNGTIHWNKHNLPEENAKWVDGAFNREDYEVRLSLQGNANGEREGAELDVWHNLGERSLLSSLFVVQYVSMGGEMKVEWKNIIYRIDIRKIGEPISGGATFGPFELVAD